MLNRKFLILFVLIAFMCSDCNLFLSLAVIAIFMLTKAVVSGKKTWYFIAGLFFGITLYTYAISYIVIPLFLLLTLIYLIYIKDIKAENVIIFAVPFIILGIPLLLEQLVNAGVIAEFSTGFMDFKRMDFYRGTEFSFKNIPQNLKDLWKLFSHDDQTYNARGLFGTVYYISIPFIVIGLFVCIKRIAQSLKNRHFDFSSVLMIYTIASLAVILVISDINVNKANNFYAALVMLTATGIAYLWNRKNAWAAVIIALYLVSFAAFGYYYFMGGYNADITTDKTGGLFQKRDLGEAARFLDNKYNGEKKIWVIANDAEEWHIIIAAFCGTSPYEYAAPGYAEGNYEIGVPEELDLTGNCAYVIGKDLHHVTDYLATEGFTVDDMMFEKYSVVYK